MVESSGSKSLSAEPRPGCHEAISRKVCDAALCDVSDIKMLLS